MAFAAAPLALAVAGLVNAVDDANLAVERVVGDGWVAENIAIDWHLPERASATIGRLKLNAAAQELRNVRIDCPRLQLSDRVIACDGARVVATWPCLGAQTLTAKLVYGRRDGSLEAAVTGIKLGDGTAKLAASLRGGAWTRRSTSCTSTTSTRPESSWNATRWRRCATRSTSSTRTR